MKELTLYNTLTGRRDRFIPRTKGRVKLFTCGPSVYRFQHLGNYRTYLFEDVLQKYLEYKNYKVDRVINFTDIEDKAIEEARQKKVEVAALRRPVEEAFIKESALLGIDLPKKIPRATTSVDGAVDLIERLLERGHAYRADGEIFYDPLTYKGFGRLYGLDMRRWPKKKVHYRKDTYPGHRWNLGDFILWHPYENKDKEPKWQTRIGVGRPAWNIQDAAMISKHLGFEIDIHTGGIDNLYRHHDYTLSIMEGASGRKFCPFWLHGGHLLIDGRKMSKSKGNVFYLNDLFGKGFSAAQIRFFLLYGPYRQSLNLNLRDLERYAGRLGRVRNLVQRLKDKAASKRSAGKEPAAAMRSAFEQRMNDNLDYAGAFDAVDGHLQRALNAGLNPGAYKSLSDAVTQMDRVLGVLV